MIKSSIHIEDKDMGFASILRNLKATEMYTTFGIHQDKGMAEKRYPAGFHTPNKVTLAQVAHDQEFGVSTPERPFLRSTFDNSRNLYISQLRDIARRVLSPNAVPIINELRSVGAKATNAVRNTIRQGIEPKLHKVSIKRKTDYPGQEIDTPLIWTGQLITALRHKEWVK